MATADTFLYVALGFNVVSVVGCLIVLMLIWLFRETKAPRQRLVLLLMIVTCLFGVFSLAWHSINLKEGNNYHVSPVVVFGDFAFWWALLVVETYMLAFLYYVLRCANNSTMQHVNISQGMEVFGWFLAFTVGAIAGTVAVETVSKTCIVFENIQVNDESRQRKCIHIFRAFVWTYIGAISIPITLQILLLYEYRKASKLNKASKSTTTQSLSRQRTLLYTVRPLVWYPALFLISALCYILWAISLSSKPNSQFPTDVAIASALTFSLKGFFNTLIYFCSRETPERSFSDQVKYVLGRQPKNQSLLDEEKIEFSSTADDESGVLYGVENLDRSRSRGKTVDSLYSEAGESRSGYFSSGNTGFSSASYQLMEDDASQ